MSGLKFEELSDSAKERALDESRYVEVEFTDWYDSVYDDFIECAECLGFTVEGRFIQFSGFWSQGDGASFAGDFASTGRAGALIRRHAAKDKTLHTLADELDLLHFEMQLVHNAAIYARICCMGRYTHSGNMSVEHCGLIAGREELDISDELYNDLGDRIVDVARRLADWLYDQLEAEHDYLTSDETIQGYFEANEQRFDESGVML